MANQNIVVSGWNAVVHLPASYTANPTKKYPTIIFFPGLGEVGTDVNKLRANGPSAYIDGGWNGITNGVEFIVISLQPSSAYPGRDAVEARLKLLKAQYRIDVTNVFLTGLSHGGGMAGAHVSYSTFYKEVKAIATYAGMLMDWTGGKPFSQFDPFAVNGGKMLVAEQADDIRYNDQVVNRMNSIKAGSGEYYITRFGGAPYGHDSWDDFYGGKGKVPQKLTNNKTVYEWFADRVGVIPNVPPVVNAGIDQIITLPLNQTTLTATASDTDGSITKIQWSVVSGSGVITSPTSLSTLVSGLTEGVTEFKIEVTDDRGAVSSDNIRINVLPDPKAKTIKVSGPVGIEEKHIDKILNVIGAVQFNVPPSKTYTPKEGDTFTLYNETGHEVTFPDGTKNSTKKAWINITFINNKYEIYGKLQ